MKFEAKNKQEEMILTYLNENMSDELKSKVENGYTVEKDGTTYLCKKDMTSLMQYIYEQAKKQAQNNCAMIEDKVVYGWAMHYLEEDSIKGKLYTLDGKEYKPTQKTEPTKPITPKQNTSTTPAPTPKKKQSGRMQMSIFDIAETPKQETILKEENNNSPSEEIQETITEIHEEKVKPSPIKPLSPFYSKYLDIQSKYPSSIVVYRLGDFYEVLGDNAKLIADKLELTLTGRDCGLESRVPMVGFPYHVRDVYLQKLAKKHKIVVIDNDKIEEIPVSEYEPEQNDDEHADEDEDIEEDIYEHFDPEAVAILEQTLENITLK